MAKKKKQKKSRSSKGLRRWRQLSFGGKLWRVLWVTLLVVWGFTIVQVLFCALFNPPLTPLMVKRFFQQVGDPERTVRFERDYVPISKISDNLVNAVVVPPRVRHPSNEDGLC